MPQRGAVFERLRLRNRFLILDPQRGTDAPDSRIVLNVGIDAVEVAAIKNLGDAVLVQTRRTQPPIARSAVQIGGDPASAGSGKRRAVIGKHITSRLGMVVLRAEKVGFGKQEHTVPRHYEFCAVIARARVYFRLLRVLRQRRRVVWEEETGTARRFWHYAVHEFP